MPIQPGDVFSRSKIAQGLENLRSLYASHGYVNFVCIPNTTFEDETARAYLDIDGSEGPQFHFRNFSVPGLDEDRAHRWQDKWETEMRGRPFSQEGLRVFFQQLFRPVDPKFDPLSLVNRDIDVQNAAVDISMIFYPRSEYEVIRSVYTHH